MVSTSLFIAHTFTSLPLLDLVNPPLGHSPQTCYYDYSQTMPTFPNITLLELFSFFIGLSPEYTSYKRLGYSIILLTISDTVLLKLTLPVLSYDLITLQILLSDYFALLVNYLSISTLLTIANMLHCSTCLLDTDFRLRLTAITLPAITQDVDPFKTIYSHSNNHYHHQYCIAHTLPDYCLSKCYITHISVLSHKTPNLSVLHVPIAIFLSSIPLGVCLIALNLNH